MNEIIAQFHDLLPDLARLAASAAFGGLVGYERERKGQAAGFRTNMLVAVAACLLGQLSLYIATIAQADAARVASYAVSGIGFIGGGAILKGKSRVRGLTTATMLWVVTGVGLSVGVGMYVPALCTALVVTGIVYLSPQMHRMAAHAQRYYTLTVSSPGGAAPFDAVVAALHGFGCEDVQVSVYECDAATDRCRLVVRIATDEELDWHALVQMVRTIPAVSSVYLGESGVP